MIIKFILVVLSIILLFVLLTTIRLIYWNFLLNRKQKQLGFKNTPKLIYSIRLVMMFLIVALMIYIRLNATMIYINLFPFSPMADCAYRKDDKEQMLIFNPDVFIVTIDSLKEIREFDVLNSRHQLLIDRYYYESNTLAVLRGKDEESNILTKNVHARHNSTNYIDFCEDGKPFEIGKTYLIIGSYTSPELASKMTDPRSRDGNWYYVSTAILLDNYDTTKPIHEQSEAIQLIIKEFSDLIASQQNVDAFE